MFVLRKCSTDWYFKQRTALATRVRFPKSGSAMKAMLRFLKKQLHWNLVHVENNLQLRWHFLDMLYTKDRPMMEKCSVIRVFIKNPWYPISSSPWPADMWNADLKKWDELPCCLWNSPSLASVTRSHCRWSWKQAAHTKPLMSKTYNQKISPSIK
jgi:hypothetical protein